MNEISDLNTRYWLWYDKLPEPERMMVAMTMLSPWIIGVALNEISPLLTLGGLLFVVLLLLARCLVAPRKP